MDKTRGGPKEISFRHDVTLTLAWISVPTEQNSLKERALFLSRGWVSFDLLNVEFIRFHVSLLDLLVLTLDSNSKRRSNEIAPRTWRRMLL